MPRMKSVSTLKHCCFKSIVKNFEKLKFSITILPDTVLNDFYQERKELEFDDRPLPLVFINRDSRSLDDVNEFSNQENLSVAVLDKICNISTKLVYLNLTGSTCLPEDLRHLMTCIPRIKKLILTKTACNKSVLAAIGENCDEIFELRLNSCEYVDDKGIEALCTTNSTSRSKKIAKLNLKNTQVTVKGLATALKNLPKLMWLFNSYLDLSETPSKVFKMEEENNFLCKNVPFLIRTETDLKILSKSFPNALSISVQFNDVIWQKRENVIKMYPNVNEILVLQVFGNYIPNTCALIRQNFSSDLDYLLFQYCSLADIFTVCHYFPYLRNLVIYNMVINQNVSSFNGLLHGFSSLIELDVNFSDVDVPESCFEKLLVSCKVVKELVIRKCKVLSDCLVKRVVAVNPLKCLEKVCFCQCDSITVESVFALVRMNNPLYVVGVVKCKNISENDLLEVKNKVCNSDLCVVTDWD